MKESLSFRGGRVWGRDGEGWYQGFDFEHIKFKTLNIYPN